MKEHICSRIGEDEFSRHVGALFKDPIEVLRTISPQKLSILHAAVGICGEAGELLDAVKKYVYYNEPQINLKNIIEELGDLEFYMQALRNTLGIDRNITLQENVIKLADRYPKGKYTDADAKARADKND